MGILTATCTKSIPAPPLRHPGRGPAAARSIGIPIRTRCQRSLLSRHPHRQSLQIHFVQHNSFPHKFCSTGPSRMSCIGSQRNRLVHNFDNVDSGEPFFGFGNFGMVIGGMVLIALRPLVPRPPLLIGLTRLSRTRPISLSGGTSHTESHFELDWETSPAELTTHAWQITGNQSKKGMHMGGMSVSL